MTGASRRLIGVLAILLALVLVDCTPQRRTRRRPEPTPSPSVTPRPKGKGPAAPTRTPAPERDTTRDPLTRLVTDGMSSRDAAALKVGDRARVELDSGTTDEAFQLLDAAIESAPKLQPLYVLRAKAFLAEGNAEMARADLDRAAALPAPTAWVAEAAAMKGAAFEVQGNKTEAIAAYRRALKIFPGNVTAKDALKRLAPEPQ
ncbi:tetratricopeptide repeat protein [Candidatus Binatia bacterium]|jgi:tetratricopeptide (TPR) repeat protein|nr:tetratricopeptide repeat protein [Candidatus Binatia bacterium]